MASCLECGTTLAQLDGPGRPRLRCEECRPNPKKRIGDITGCIYFLEAEGIGRVKIGFTAGTAEQRAEQLQIGCPAPLRVIGSIPGSMSAERALHRKFEHSAVPGTSEWFEGTQEIRRFIDRSLAFAKSLQDQMGDYLVNQCETP